MELLGRSKFETNLLEINDDAIGEKMFDVMHSGMQSRG
jgi:hypothetical protein